MIIGQIASSDLSFGPEFTYRYILTLLHCTCAFHGLMHFIGYFLGI